MTIENSSPSALRGTRPHDMDARPRDVDDGFAAEDPFPERAAQSSARIAARVESPMRTSAAFHRARNALREAPGVIVEPMPPSKPVRSPRACRTAISRPAFIASAVRILIGRRPTTRRIHRQRARRRFARVVH
jgi:hypothetical protein